MMRSYLKGFRLDVNLPKASPNANNYFVQLANGPQDFDYTLFALSKVAHDIRTRPGQPKLSSSTPIISKFDATRDLKGTFFVPIAIILKYKQLKTELERKLNITILNKSNSYNSCFEFL